MCEIEPGCRRCSRQYSKLLSEYWYQRRQIRKMRKSFAAIECALTHKCERTTEFIIGEITFKNAIGKNKSHLALISERTKCQIKP